MVCGSNREERHLTNSCPLRELPLPLGLGEACTCLPQTPRGSSWLPASAFSWLMFSFPTVLNLLSRVISEGKGLGIRLILTIWLCLALVFCKTGIESETVSTPSPQLHAEKEMKHWGKMVWWGAPSSVCEGPLHGYIWWWHSSPYLILLDRNSGEEWFKVINDCHFFRPQIPPFYTQGGNWHSFPSEI